MVSQSDLHVKSRTRSGSMYFGLGSASSSAVSGVSGMRLWIVAPFT